MSNIMQDGETDFESDNENGNTAAVATVEPEATNPVDKFKQTFTIPHDIPECLDGKGHFKEVPAKQKDDYPLRSEVKDKLREIHPEFSLIQGFSRITAEEGQKYYFISKRFLKELLEWLEQDDTDANESDLTVDNTVMMDYGTKSKVKKHLLSSSTQMVGEDVWNQLMEWFGGGPAVFVRARKDKSRMVKVDNSGKLVRVVCMTDPTSFKRFFFSSYDSVIDAKKEICEAFDVEPDKCRLHDYYKFKPFARLDKPKDEGSLLTSKHLMEDNMLLLEVADEEGNYVIKYSTQGYFRIEQMNDTIETSHYGTNVGVPGVVGLKNLGNTCYMNSTLQCLSNVPMLKDVFLQKLYEPDINLNNVLGYQGKVATAFGKLMERMWSGQGNVVAPHGFKRVISEAKTDFQGYEQHDSQEFLSELLDAIHEDTNRIKNKPYLEWPTQDGRPDAVVAQDSMDTHKARNSSFIVDLFTGLYKSTVTCPEEGCNNVSVTFDPFTVLPLPLQSGVKHYHVLHVVHVPMDPHEEPFAIDVIAPKHGPFLLLRNLIKDQVGITARNRRPDEETDEGRDELTKRAQVYTNEENKGKRDIAVFSAMDGRIRDYMEDDDRLSRLSPSNDLISFEVFDDRKFQNFVFVADEKWKRPLDFPRETKRRRYDEPLYSDDDDSQHAQHVVAVEIGDPMALADDAVEVNAVVADEGRRPARTPAPVEAFEPIAVGFKGCPFLAGDTFHGSYNFNDTEQIIRIEISQVVRCTWEDYQLYSQTVNSLYPPPQKETEMDEQTFANTAVYLISAFCDTKEKTYTQMYGSYGAGRTLYNTVFEMKGLFIANDKPTDELNLGLATNLTKSGKNVSQAMRKSAKTDEGKPKKDEQKSQGSGGKENKRKGSKNEKGDGKAKKDGGKDRATGGKKTFGAGLLGGFKWGKKSNAGETEEKSKRSETKKSPKSNSKRGKDDKTAKAKPEQNEKPTKEEKTPKAGSKTGPKEEKGSKKTEVKKSPKSKENIFRKADATEVGSLEKSCICGTFTLRPFGQVEKVVASAPARYYGYRTQQVEDFDESREAIVLTGSIDDSHRMMWGKYVVDRGFAKGEFLLQKYESLNWDSAKLSREPSTTEEEDTLMSLSEFPKADNRDGRLLVQICHKAGTARAFQFANIPEAFFVPADITESEFMEILDAKYTIWLRAEMKRLKLEEKVKVRVVDEDEDGNEVETEREVDRVEFWLRQMKVVRATPRFMTKYHPTESLKAGDEIDRQADTDLQVSRYQYNLWLLVEWEQDSPFSLCRPLSLFEAPQDTESLMTLDAALDLFTKTEKLNAMNAWYCRECKEHREAYKQLQIWSLPTVLVVQFKRFSQDEGRSVADKLEIPVDFPFEMDMSSRALCFEADLDLNDAVAVANRKLEFEYELVAVSSHVGGGLGFGHYIACAKNEIDNKWYQYNDDSVSYISDQHLDRIVNPQAYVLFYVRKGALQERKQQQEAAAADAVQEVGEGVNATAAPTEDAE